MTFFSNFNKIDTNIKRKISSLKEENLILQRKIDYCSHEFKDRTGGRGVLKVIYNAGINT